MTTYLSYSVSYAILASDSAMHEHQMLPEFMRGDARANASLQAL